MAKKKASKFKPKKKSAPKQKKKEDDIDPAYQKRPVVFEDDPVDVDDEVDEVGMENDDTDDEEFE